MFFNIVKDLFTSTEGLLRSGKVQVCSKGERIFVLGGLRKKVFNTLSDFALKILSLHSLTNSVLQYSEGRIQIKCGPTCEWESPNRFQGRKNCCSRCSEKEVLNTLSDFALKILSLHSLTNSVFQYSEGLIRINCGPTYE